MEESTWKGVWPILKRKHGDATNFLPAAALIFCQMVQLIAALGKASRSSLPRKVVRPGYIMHIAAPCLSASPCRQN